MATMRVVKKELRSRVKRILSGVPRESIIEQSAVITERLLSLPEYQAAQRLSVYLSMPSGEIITTKIVRDAFNKGKQVFVPYIYEQDPSAGAGKSSIMEMLALRSLEDYESLQPDRWGIPTIDASTVPSRKNCLGGYGLQGESSESIDTTDSGLDLIVVPGLAFDQDLRRLGHGKGYYDHFLNRYWSSLQNSTARKPYLAALSLHEQVLPPPEQVPVADHDRLVDALVIGDGRILKRES